MANVLVPGDTVEMLAGNRHISYVLEILHLITEVQP